MNWKNLKNNKCPMCNHLLNEKERGHECTSSQCSFFIGKEKFNNIIGDQYAPRKKETNTEDENREALNGLTNEDLNGAPY